MCNLNFSIDICDRISRPEEVRSDIPVERGAALKRPRNRVAANLVSFAQGDYNYETRILPRFVDGRLCLR
jgi:hypothetical protein